MKKIGFEMNSEFSVQNVFATSWISVSLPPFHHPRSPATIFCRSAFFMSLDRSPPTLPACSLLTIQVIVGQLQIAKKILNCPWD
jgi:hypothetical protein